MADRRRFPRARLSFETEVWVDTPSGPTHLEGRFVLLGAGGACLELDESFSVCNLLNLTFTLPQTGDTIGLPGDCAECRGRESRFAHAGR